MKDFLDDLVEEWTKAGPEFPKLLEEAKERRKADTIRGSVVDSLGKMLDDCYEEEQRDLES